MGCSSALIGRRCRWPGSSIPDQSPRRRARSPPSCPLRALGSQPEQPASSGASSSWSVVETRTRKDAPPMDLYEYQAKDLFRAHGVPVLPGAIATTPEQARAVAQDMFDHGSGLVVVKAQVKTGGRGKAGGVKLARSAEEARAVAQDILGMDIKGHTDEYALSLHR